MHLLARSFALLLAACGGSGGGSGGGEGAPDASSTPGPDGAPGDNLGEVPDPVPQSGVAYIAHFHSADLQIIRLDGTNPEAQEPFNLGGPAHNLALDPVRDLLVAVHDTQKRAALYQLERPDSPDAPLPPPEPAGVVTFDSVPVFATFHPYRKELYVIEVPPLPGGGGPITEMFFHMYDVSDPDAPAELDGSPHSIPPTTSFAIDPARNVLWLVSLVAKRLHGYDLSDRGLTPLPGDPIDLRALYPEDNQFAFQARSLTVDMWRNRLLAAREQGALSELIALEFPGDVPRGGARYGQFAAMDDLRVMQDPFDLSLPPGDRQNLLGAYRVGLDPGSGAVFMSARAWNGGAATAIVAAYAPALETLAPGCEDFEGFGCFYRSYEDSEPGVYLRTDGAFCIDAENQVAVGTSTSEPETAPGRAVFFRYQDDLTMIPWLPAGGGDMAAGSLPIGAVCH